MARYRTIPVEVIAEQFVQGKPVPGGLSYMWGGYMLMVAGGSVPVEPSDWVVTYAHGEREVYSDSAFKTKFIEIPEETKKPKKGNIDEA